MPRNIGYAALDATSPLAPLPFDRAPLGPEDVRIEVSYCGVCHTDVHHARGESPTHFPCMPGHEIIGIVSEIGDAVTMHRIGDRVGVGCMIYWGDESDRGAGDEQYRAQPAIFTYGAQDPATGTVTFGGYSDELVVHEHFVLPIPESLDSAAAAPLLCAGITTYSPLRHWNVGPGTTVGIAGIGGLGHVAVQIAAALGATVVALTTSPEKAEDARALGASDVVVMTDEDDVARYARSLDVVLSTVPVPFDMKPHISLIRNDGAFVGVGMLTEVRAGDIDYGIISNRRITLSGSAIGSIAETQEMLDFCAQHGVAARIEIIAADQLNAAFDRVVAGDVRFRFVLDASTLRTR